MQTQLRIPGAIGFPGEFTSVVLGQDPNEDYYLDGGEPLSSDREEADTARERNRQRLIAIRRSFMNQFPFDVINLDLEQFLFKPNDPFPGEVVNALRKVFAWQRRSFRMTSGRTFSVDGFSLMLTTQVGPPNMSADYRDMLREKIDRNLAADTTLVPLLSERTGMQDLAAIERDRFDIFFEIGLPKVLMAILMEEDWYVDPSGGILIFEFERNSKDGPYKILHLVADIQRQSPPREQRGPGQNCQVAQQAYQSVTKSVFANAAMVVTPDTVDTTSLRESLELIRARRRTYCPDA